MAGATPPPPLNLRSTVGIVWLPVFIGNHSSIHCRMRLWICSAKHRLDRVRPDKDSRSRTNYRRGSSPPTSAVNETLFGVLPLPLLVRKGFKSLRQDFAYFFQSRRPTELQIFGNFRADEDANSINLSSPCHSLHSKLLDAIAPHGIAQPCRPGYFYVARRAHLHFRFNDVLIPISSARRDVPWQHKAR